MTDDPPYQTMTTIAMLVIRVISGPNTAWFFAAAKESREPPVVLQLESIDLRSGLAKAFTIRTPRIFCSMRAVSTASWFWISLESRLCLLPYRSAARARKGMHAMLSRARRGLIATSTTAVELAMTTLSSNRNVARPATKRTLSTSWIERERSCPVSAWS